MFRQFILTLHRKNVELGAFSLLFLCGFMQWSSAIELQDSTLALQHPKVVARSLERVKEEEDWTSLIDQDKVVALQIFLDQQHFGPGVIDGKMGKFTRLAVRNYNVSKKRGKGDKEVLAEAQRAVSSPYATALVPLKSSRYVNAELPEKREEQSNEKMMSYRSIAEFMAERYHTTEDFLITLNGEKKLRGARGRTALKVPNIAPFCIEKLSIGRSHAEDEILSARRIVVDTKRNQLYIYVLDLKPSLEPSKKTQVVSQLIATFPITPGREKFDIRGIWNLKKSIELPEWRYDKKLLEKGVRSKEAFNIPPGPNNPVGVIWNGLSRSGIGIHGTNNPRLIGRSRSAGCIRMTNWDAVRIPLFVRPGAVVEVR